MSHQLRKLLVVQRPGEESYIVMLEADGHVTLSRQVTAAEAVEILNGVRDVLARQTLRHTLAEKHGQSI